MTYRDRLDADLRLSVLRLLEAAGTVGLAEPVLRDLLEDDGRRPSRDGLRTQLSWLAEQGLAETREASDGWVVLGTARGNDVALGRATTPGVRRPAP